MVFFTVSTFLTFHPNLQVVRNQIEECKTTTFIFFLYCPPVNRKRKAVF